MTLHRHEVPDQSEAQVHRDRVPRRRIDIEHYATLSGLLVMLVSIGIAWGTASATVSQKLDKNTFDAHVAEVARRIMFDSMRGSHTDAALRRIELKQDSTNHRLQLLVCENKPPYCQ